MKLCELTVVNTFDRDSSFNLRVAKDRSIDVMVKKHTQSTRIFPIVFETSVERY